MKIKIDDVAKRDKQEKIGARIKYRREQLDLSQLELAKKLGYKNRSAIAHMENGDVDFSSQKAAAIAKVLETTPEFLLGWADEDYERNRSARLISRYDELADFEKSMVRKIMNCDEDFYKIRGKKKDES